MTAPRQTTRRRGRPTGGTPVVTVEEIAEAAERMIREKGVDVSLDDIAVAAGVTKPTVYRVVGDKNAMVGLLARRLTARSSAEVAAAIESTPPTASPRAQFEALVLGVVMAVARDPEIYLYSSGTGDPLGALLLADEVAPMIADGLRTVCLERGLDPSPVEPAAYGFVGMLHYSLLWWLRAGDRTPEKLAADLAGSAWDGFGALLG